MPLSDDEKRTLAALTKKAKEPDEPAPGRMLNFTIDLANDTAVANAKKLGIFPEDDPPADDPPGDDPPVDEPPARSGFFGNK